MKRCTKCGETKSLDNFGAAKLGKDGLRAVCNACHYAYNKEWRSRHPEKVKAWNDKWNVRHRRGYRLMRYYQMTLEEWDRRLAEQGGVCAGPGCEAAPTQVDHDHSCCPGLITCGKCVRGLVCASCNARDVLANPSS